MPIDRLDKNDFAILIGQASSLEALRNRIGTMQSEPLAQDVKEILTIAINGLNLCAKKIGQRCLDEMVDEVEGWVLAGKDTADRKTDEVG